MAESWMRWIFLGKFQGQGAGSEPEEDVDGEELTLADEAEELEVAASARPLLRCGHMRTILNFLQGPCTKLISSSGARHLNSAKASAL